MRSPVSFYILFGGKFGVARLLDFLGFFTFGLVLRILVVGLEAK